MSWCLGWLPVSFARVPADHALQTASEIRAKRNDLKVRLVIDQSLSSSFQRLGEQADMPGFWKSFEGPDGAGTHVGSLASNDDFVVALSRTCVLQKWDLQGQPQYGIKLLSGQGLKVAYP